MKTNIHDGEGKATWLEKHFARSRELPRAVTAIVLGEAPDGRFGMILVPPVGYNFNADGPVPLSAAVAARMVEEAQRDMDRIAGRAHQSESRSGVFFVRRGSVCRVCRQREIANDLAGPQEVAARNFGAQSRIGEVLHDGDLTIVHMLEPDAIYRSRGGAFPPEEKS